MRARSGAVARSGTGITVLGWSALSSAGIGPGALAERVAGVDPAGVPADRGGDVGRLYEEPVPSPWGHAVADFNVRALLGRKGTGTYDRATALAVTCCKDALESAGTAVDDTTRGRVGVVLGTSVGSFKSTSDFSRETFVEDKPYLVNPLLFPNAVMNYAAGQVAIRFGLRGVNATIAGGAMAFLDALRYAGNVVERGHADVVLTGAVEEYTPHRAWASQLTGVTASIPIGEAAGVFVLARSRPPEWAGKEGAARVPAVVTGYGPGGGERAERALRGCVSRALHRAGADAAQISAVFTGETDDADRGEYGPVADALGHEPKRIMVKRLFGECDAASGAIALAVLLASEGDGCYLLTGRGRDGAVGAAVVDKGTR